MDFFAAMAIISVEVIVGVLGYRKWLRLHGERDEVKTGFVKALIAHRHAGDLDRYIQDFITGKISITRKRKRFSSVVRAVASMFIGILVCVLIFRLLAPGLLVKTILGALLMIPSAHLLAVAIAEEADENGISRFERSAREQLSSARENGAIEAWMEKFAH